MAWQSLVSFTTLEPAELMIYELRMYAAVAGRRAALIARFQNHTLRAWEDSEFRALIRRTLQHRREATRSMQ